MRTYSTSPGISCGGRPFGDPFSALLGGEPGASRQERLLRIASLHLPASIPALQPGDTPDKTHSWREWGHPQAPTGLCPLSLLSLPQQSRSLAELGSVSSVPLSPPPQIRSPWAEQCSLSQNDSQRLPGSLGVQKINAALPAN